MIPPHPLAGRSVPLRVQGADPDRLNGKAFVVEDWAARKFGDDRSRPVYQAYARRAAFAGLPDTDLVFGRVGVMSLLVHASELGGVPAEAK